MIRAFQGSTPQIDPSAFIHESSEIIGKVTLEKDCSIWPYAVLRGDIEEIRIGPGANVQDHAVIHTNYGLPAIVGEEVTVGHSANLHGCHIHARCIIGTGAIILDGAVVEEDCVIAAGAVVPPHAKVPKGSMVMGIPAKAVRSLRPEEIAHIRKNAKDYVDLKEEYKK